MAFRSSKTTSNEKLTLAVALVAFISSIFLMKVNTELIQGDKTRKTYYAPPAQIKQFTFGFHEVTSDLFWIRVLQDIDRCEQKMIAPGGRRTGTDRIHDCSRGWVYHMLNIVFECAPRWRIPAAVGPLLLSVVVDDINGASDLFKKAVQNHPTDWSILFRAGYHFLYETTDHLYAAQLFDEAGKNGAPKWVHALAGKLYSQTGRNYVARIVLQDAMKRTPPGPIQDKIKERLDDVEAKIKEIEAKPSSE